MKGYRTIPFSTNRRMAAASASVAAERNTIHALLEVDISTARRLMREHRERTGETLSLTAYVIACLARTLAEQPQLNAFRRGRHLIVLDDVTVSTLVERSIGGERIPEPFGIRAAQRKTFREIHDEIRAAQQHGDDGLGGLSGMQWVARWVPSWLFRAFIRLASRNIGMAQRYGVVSVTAVGMYGSSASWFVPLGGATVVVAVGSIVERPVLRDGAFEAREHLCVTVSFDHDIVDGAPAARFTKRFAEWLESGELLRRVGEGPGSA